MEGTPQDRKVQGGPDHLSALGDQAVPGGAGSPFSPGGPATPASPFGPWLPSLQLAKKGENAITTAIRLVGMLLDPFTIISPKSCDTHWAVSPENVPLRPQACKVGSGYGVTS